MARQAANDTMIRYRAASTNGYARKWRALDTTNARWVDLTPAGNYRTFKTQSSAQRRCDELNAAENAPPLPMTDAELIEWVGAFRDGILNGDLPTMKCFMVCAPLAGLLACLDIEAELIESDLGWVNHCWLRLPDGRALDPTADQFNYLDDAKMPKVYLGPPTKYHLEKTP
jgi:hypothetical protein